VPPASTARLATATTAHAQPAVGPRYKWIALSNTTLGVLMATINSSIVLIALPDIFRGIGINPLQPGNTTILLWMIMGFLVVTSVLVVSFGRLGDMFGRVRMYNMGFAVFALFSILLSVSWMSGAAAGWYLIAMRIFQGVGGAMLIANSSAILTDAFPANQRGMALGLNQVAGIAGSFIGLVLGGLLGPVDWRLVFLVSVPVGVLGTVWSYLKLKELGVRKPAKLDWWGNVTFAAGLIAVLVGITYGIQPYGGHVMGWTSPLVLTLIIGGIATLIAFCYIETKVAEPMFRLSLFKIRPFTAGNVASLLSGLGRGGLMFILIIWLQGIYLPMHGYNFVDTPLWAGIAMLPLTVGFLVAGPISGFLSDKFGARPFATGGMLVAALSFLLLELLPVNFSYPEFAAILFLNGAGMGLFASPNRAGIMNSLPASRRGVGAGMSATFQNSSMVLSIGIFFSLIILGLSSSLAGHLFTGLTAHGVPAADAIRLSHLPPTAVMFAALLGYNPIQMLLGPVLTKLPASNQAFLTGHSFFPSLISAPFHAGLSVAFDFAIAACLIAAVASLLRGKHYVHDDHAPAAVVADAVVADAVAEDGAMVQASTPEEAGYPERTGPALDPVPQLLAGGAARDRRLRSFGLRRHHRDGRVVGLDAAVGAGHDEHRGDVPGAQPFPLLFRGHPGDHPVAGPQHDDLGGRRHGHERADTRPGHDQAGPAEFLDGLGAGEPVDAPFLLHLVAARDLRPDRQIAADDPVADGARDLQVDLLA
jgi:MFS family permease